MPCLELQTDFCSAFSQATASQNDTSLNRCFPVRMSHCLLSLKTYLAWKLTFCLLLLIHYWLVKVLLEIGTGPSRCISRGVLFSTFCCFSFWRPTHTDPLVTRMICLPLLTRASNCSTRAPSLPKARRLSFVLVTTAVPTCTWKSNPYTSLLSDPNS